MYRAHLKPFRDRAKTKLFLGLFILILIYSGFRLFNYISGPKITIYSPLPYEKISGETFLVKGNIKNAKNIYLNGREISIDENGNFVEEIISKSPYNLVTVKAIDRYKKEKNTIFEVAKE